MTENEKSNDGVQSRPKGTVKKEIPSEGGK